MSKRKFWWEVVWDVPTFPTSPGRLEYKEFVKATHPQIALWKASQRFLKKVHWVLDNQMKSLGGEKTQVGLMVGLRSQAGRPIGDQLNESLEGYFREISKPYADSYSPGALFVRGCSFSLGIIQPDYGFLSRLNEQYQVKTWHKEDCSGGTLLKKIKSHNLVLEFCWGCEEKRITKS